LKFSQTLRGRNSAVSGILNSAFRKYQVQIVVTVKHRVSYGQVGIGQEALWRNGVPVRTDIPKRRT
jgi:hypothetical protein